MTEPSTLSALIDQRHYVSVAHNLTQNIEATVPIDSITDFWRGEASVQYQSALHQLLLAIVSSRVWLENASTDVNSAIAEAENA